MRKATLETLGWTAGLAVTLATLMFSTALAAWIVTSLLAAAWCRRLDADEDAVQLVGPDAWNRYPTQGSVSR